MTAIACIIIAVVLWAVSSSIIIYNVNRCDVGDVFFILFFTGLLSGLFSPAVVFAWPVFLGFALFIITCILLALAVKKGEAWYDKRKLAKNAQTFNQEEAAEEHTDGQL